ncbi:hypothetical protein AMTR_s00194p00017210 [Amborella trichopoda]|uniref:Uncharacterized protein n=1 Tax=Amborella trichopoda TaxID=13333 RepID=U5DC04_AMBTC|nr:hypothetical protein AMTR_s00194p00017210 [Amborella trichopoda]
MASNSNSSTSTPIIPIPPPYGELPFISKAEEVLSKTEVRLDLVCSTLENVNATLTKIEDTIQRIARDFEVVEDGLEELRSSATVTVRGRSFQCEASRTKKDKEKSVACEALIFINLLPNLADTLSETRTENKGLQLHQSELLAALDASHSVSWRAERELLDIQNTMQARSRDSELVVDANIQLSTQLPAYRNEPLPPLDFNLEDLEPV